MKLKKKQVIRIFILMIIIALIVGGALFVKEVVFSNESKVIYGTRTKDAKKNKIPEDVLTKAKEGLKEDANRVNIRIAGRIIDITLIVKTETTLEDAKKIGAKAAEFFNDYTVYYDTQIMINKEEKTNQFPIIGYRHHDINSKKYNIVWTKDRAEN